MKRLTLLVLAVGFATAFPVAATVAAQSDVSGAGDVASVELTGVVSLGDGWVAVDSGSDSLTCAVPAGIDLSSFAGQTATLECDYVGDVLTFVEIELMTEGSEPDDEADDEEDVEDEEDEEDVDDEEDDDAV